MTDPAEPTSSHGSPELAELVHRTMSAKRAPERSGHASPSPSWAIAIRFRLAGFRPRSALHR